MNRDRVKELIELLQTIDERLERIVFITDFIVERVPAYKIWIESIKEELRFREKAKEEIKKEGGSVPTELENTDSTRKAMERIEEMKKKAMELLQ